MTSLADASFYTNQFNGTLPKELGNLISLTRQRLHINKLTGSIPREVGLLTEINELSLSWNALLGFMILTGAIPAELEIMVPTHGGLLPAIPRQSPKLFAL
jgi:hypothetical protein